MNSAGFQAFLMLLAAIDKTLSYSKFVIRIELADDTEIRRACDECIQKGVSFKVVGDYITLYRGDR